MLNVSLEFYTLFISSIILLCSTTITLKKYNSNKDKFLLYFGALGLSSMFFLLFMALSVIYMSLILYKVSILMTIPYQYFIITATDKLSRFTVDPKKRMFIGIYLSGILFEIFVHNKIEERILDNGGILFDPNPLLVVWIILNLFMTGFLFFIQILKIYKYSKENSKKYAKWGIFGGVIYTLAPSISYTTGLYENIPGTILFFTSIGFIIITLSYVLSPDLSKVLIAISDDARLTEYNKLEKNLQNTRRRFKNLVENTTDVIIEFNKNGEIIYSNRDRVGLEGLNIFELPKIKMIIKSTNIKDPSIIYDIIDRLKKGEAIINEQIEFQSLEGEYHVYLINIITQFKTVLIPVDVLKEFLNEDIHPIEEKKSSVIQGYILIGRDITQLNIMAKQIEEKNVQLIRAQKLDAVGTLASGVAHDFNNILQVILGYADLIKLEESVSPNILDSVEEIVNASNRGKKITKQILSITRKSKEEFNLIEINHEIESIVEVLSRMIPKMIEIKLDLCEEELYFTGDNAQLQQIFMNLAINSRDAMPNGGIIKISTKKETLEEFDVESKHPLKPGPHVVISLGDNGFGMSEEVKKRIFEAFFTTKPVGKGTGLGLFIIYNIINNHEGYIKFYSEENVGTEYKIYFPLKEMDSKELPKDLEIEVVEKEDFSGKETILIVDDEKQIRKLMTLLLQQNGYNVLIASNGEEGLEMWKKHHKTINLIILDMIMPKMSGDVLLNIIFNNKDNLHIPKIIISTGFTSKDTLDKIRNYDIKDILYKPFTSKEYLNIIRKALDDAYIDELSDKLWS